MKLINKTILGPVAIFVLMSFFALSVSAAASPSFGDWVYLGYRSYPSYAQFWARTCVLYDGNHTIEGYSNIHSAYQDSGTGNWVTVLQQPYMMRAGVSLYKNAAVAEGVSWKYNNGSASLVSVLADVPAELGNEYYTKGKAQYYYQGNYIPALGTDGYNLYESPHLYFTTGSLSLQNGIERELTAAYLRSCGTTKFVYGLTSDGETYGSELLADVLGKKPDWIFAIASNGESGYIDADDHWVPEATSPADAMANYSIERVKMIPVYAEPAGEEVVGYFEMHYGGPGETEPGPGVF